MTRGCRWRENRPGYMARANCSRFFNHHAVPTDNRVLRAFRDLVANALTSDIELGAERPNWARSVLCGGAPYGRSDLRPSWLNDARAVRRRLSRGQESAAVIRITQRRGGGHGVVRRTGWRRG